MFDSLLTYIMGHFKVQLSSFEELCTEVIRWGRPVLGPSGFAGSPAQAPSEPSEVEVTN
jgi:hypothetical protein